jgi:hypothetical protein
MQRYGINIIQWIGDAGMLQYIIEQFCTRYYDAEAMQLYVYYIAESSYAALALLLLPNDLAKEVLHLLVLLICALENRNGLGRVQPHLLLLRCLLGRRVPHVHVDVHIVFAQQSLDERLREQRFGQVRGCLLKTYAAESSLCACIVST